MLPFLTPSLTNSPIPGGNARSGDINQAGSTFSFGGINEAEPAIQSGNFQVSHGALWGVLAAIGAVGLLMVILKHH